MNQKHIYLTIGLLATAQISPVLADDDTGFYIGAAVSRTDVSANQFDESDNEPALKLGFMFNSNFGIELGAIDIGTESTTNTSVDVGILSIAGVASYSFADYVNLNGKLGVAEVALTLKEDDIDVTDDKEEEFYWAVGGELDYGALNYYVEYNRFDGPASSNINILAIGVKYEF